MLWWWRRRDLQYYSEWGRDGKCKDDGVYLVAMLDEEE